ncbi:hypothetical protein BH23BAC1_BH23BAC1_46580 [soil metagenome]
MTKKERRSYDKEFKLMAVKLHPNGKSITDVSKELGIPTDLVRRWKREYKEFENNSFPGNGKQNLS